MKKIKKWIIPIIIFMLISIYVVLTIPHGFVKKNQVIGIEISYIDNIMNAELQISSLKSNDEISEFMNILKGYHYRYYLDTRNFIFEKITSEIIISIVYNEQDYDTIHIYSDGAILVNNKKAHIGFMGKRKSKELFNDIYELYKTNSYSKSSK